MMEGLQQGLQGLLHSTESASKLFMNISRYTLATICCTSAWTPNVNFVLIVLIFFEKKDQHISSQQGPRERFQTLFPV